MAKRPFNIGFDTEESPNVDAFINSAGSGEVVAESVSKPKKSNQIKDRERIRAEVLKSSKSDIQPERQPKNGRSKSVYFENNLNSRDRKPFYVGTAINVPLFVEEFRLIEEAFKGDDSTTATTLTDYIREVLRSKAEAVLSPEKYSEIANQKLNMVSVKEE
ncbi:MULTISPECIES: hypothetical protein [Acinetobacter]|uniref:hypothetical protein n=1 Tax=Acinetobacter TaxID=469 RepID=UPI0002AE8C49|nr:MULTISPECIES: hypothetical protein [Acinetobacter]ELW77052.1 hypothetical protein ACINWC743_A0618 [Acinetobacter sp. WC-743]MBJ8428137.1 hypothetical protein [Acinetobacter bereziniae]